MQTNVHRAGSPRSYPRDNTDGSSNSPTPSDVMLATRGIRTCRMMPFG